MHFFCIICSSCIQPTLQNVIQTRVNISVSETIIIDYSVGITIRFAHLERF